MVWWNVWNEAELPPITLAHLDYRLVRLLFFYILTVRVVGTSLFGMRREAKCHVMLKSLFFFFFLFFVTRAQAHCRQDTNTRPSHICSLLHGWLMNIHVFGCHFGYGLLVNHFWKQAFLMFNNFYNVSLLVWWEKPTEVSWGDYSSLQEVFLYSFLQISQAVP